MTLTQRLNERGADALLAARLRARLGRFVSHPRAVTVTVRDGVVVLEGPILRREHRELMPALAAMPSLRELVDRLEVHDAPGRIPALHERRRGTGEGRGVRMAVGTLGGLLALRGLTRRGLASRLGGVLGAALLTRAIANRPLSRLASPPEGFTFTKTLTIRAPLPAVYEVFQHPENFPRFMRHVLHVTDLGMGRSHWTVRGPAGLPVSFDSVVTEQVENEILAWRCEPGSPLEQAGTARFEENPDGSTRLHLQLAYHPPAGLVGHAVATFLGANPGQELEEDLHGLKRLLEPASVGT